MLELLHSDGISAESDEVLAFLGKDFRQQHEIGGRTFQDVIEFADRVLRNKKDDTVVCARASPDWFSSVLRSNGASHCTWVPIGRTTARFPSDYCRLERDRESPACVCSSVEA